MTTRTYPSAGAALLAATGRSVSDSVFDAAEIPAEELISVKLLSNRILNTSPGFRPSDAAYEAVSVWKRGDIAAVNAARGIA